ncbi:hypothetical protein FD12_GL000088 [Lentilactobacillus rapi DSM 19907 = JCM 15042]|uniref:Uncharacterized protein n=2 Tax=Lentilactobacillus rapi TaxID=481723 RepID=A0A512PNT1_9LACO|nr:hypothetical protein [Lentilactobacillus rapi]KRL18254.1 hypothetical protein FD12_GL000088 [Lentilactobacillus rapi DSM 19907 = JCM 15042]GEP72849.1 hypothetical protein LRA02_17170 [Lentilactobacillus rapi]
MKLILPNQNYTAKSISDTKHNQEATDISLGEIIIVGNEEGAIIKYLKNKTTISRPQVEKLLSVKTSQARRYLKSLIRKQLIESIGSGPQTRYQLAHRISIK